jgi:hypothetical protein
MLSQKEKDIATRKCKNNKPNACHDLIKNPKGKK